MKQLAGQLGLQNSLKQTIAGLEKDIFSRKLAN